MTDRASTIALLKQVYAARKGGDLEAMMGLFTSDATFQLTGAPDIVPFAVKVAGQAELREAMASLIAGFQFVSQEFQSFIVDGDRVAVHSHLVLRNLANDKQITTEVADLWHVKDGKVAGVIEFMDNAALSYALAD